MPNPTLPVQKLFEWEKAFPLREHLIQPTSGGRRILTFSESANEVRRMASYLMSQNLPAHSSIAILSKNCAHWMLADFAIWLSGHVSVPLYPNLTGSAIAEILEHSESKLIFVGKLDRWEDAKSGIPESIKKISFPYNSPKEFPNWDDFTRNIKVADHFPDLKASDTATIIYTSGTTGRPKGVKHRYSTIAIAGTGVCESVDLKPSDIFFSYLPLAHVAERLLTETVALYCGGTIGFVQSLDTFASDLRNISPTVFLGVPRIWEKFREGILTKLPEHKLKRLLSIPILSGLIKKKIKKTLGLQRSRFTVTGAAPISESLLEFYSSLGIELQEGYAMTENFAYSHCSRPGKCKFGWVGQPWPGVSAKIGENEELLVQSPTVMDGYFKSDRETEEVLRDGWLHTGDQGKIDAEGYLQITGRAKDLFKTSKGKYVCPAPIEKHFAIAKHLDQVCVVGIGLPQPIIVVTLNELGQRGSRPDVQKELLETLSRVNENLELHERLSKLIVLKEAFSVENGLLTPTFKTKRNVIEQKYRSSFNEWTSTSELIVWFSK